METQRIYLGTELKLNINIAPMGNLSMDDYDFTIEMRCNANNVITIRKQETIRVDADNYIVCVDTNKLGVGKLICVVKAQIPDGDFIDGYRSEVVAINTNINIVKVA